MQKAINELLFLKTGRRCKIGENSLRTLFTNIQKENSNY